MTTDTEQVYRGQNFEAQDVEALSQIGVFKSTEREALRNLLSECQRRCYGRGQWILGPSEDGGASFVIVEGRARMARVSEQGQEINLLSLRTGDLFGLSFLSRPGTPKSFVEAVESGTTAYRIPCDQLQRFMLQNPAVAIRVLDLASRRFGYMCDRVEELVLYDVKTRVARTLARLAAVNGQRTVRETHEQLASRVGTRQDEVTKAISHFRRLGLVTSRPHRPGIELLDVERLASYGEERA